MVDFTGLLGAPSHSCSSGAADPIFSTQRIPRWGDPIGGGLRIVSGEHVRIVSGEHREIIGGRCVRKWRFSKEESAFAGYKFFQELSFIFLMKNRGDDATENVNFQRRKQRLQGSKNFKLNFDEFFDER